MKEILELFKLGFREQKRLFLGIGSAVFVAGFTYLFVNLVQPIIDDMFQIFPSVQREQTNLMKSVFKIFNVSQE